MARARAGDDRSPRVLPALILMALLVGLMGLGPATPATAGDVVPEANPREVTTNGVGEASARSRRLAEQVDFTRARIAAAKSQQKAVAQQRARLKGALKTWRAEAEHSDAGLKATLRLIPKAKKAQSRSIATAKDLDQDRRKAAKVYAKRSKTAHERHATKQLRAASAKAAAKAENKAAKKATSGRKSMAAWQMAAVEEAYADASSARAAELSAAANAKALRAGVALNRVATALAQTQANAQAHKRTVTQSKAAVKRLEARRTTARKQVRALKSQVKSNTRARDALRVHVEALQGVLAQLERKSAEARRTRS